MSQSSQLRGALFMVLATGCYVVNDTMMKLATETLPPYEVLMLRGFAALLWGLPLVLILGYGRRLRMMFEPRVLARNLSETLAILCFVVALANMPIADASALSQVTPLLVLMGASVVLGETMSRSALALIGLGFVGALLVAQPTGSGISFYALLALGNAVFCAVRDLAGRRVGTQVPGMIVALSAVVVVLAGAIAGHLLLEEWEAPPAASLWLLEGAGFFLVFGHFFIFMAYRTGRMEAVAPFYYCFTLWAVISGALVFGQFPNFLSIIGMALVIASGCAIVILNNRARRFVPAG